MSNIYLNGINLSSWQILTFQPRPVSFIRIIGTHNTANEVFHCVHFECPCDVDVLQKHVELTANQQPANKISKLSDDTNSNS